MRDYELAWCAGFFDAEGSTTGTAGRLKLSASQKSFGFAPEVLVRLQAALGGHMNGPYANSDTMTWHTSGRNAIPAMARLWPWLSVVKRAQFRSRATDGQFLSMTALVKDVTRTPRSEAAWAAGFFDGDGCTSLEPRPLRFGIRYTMRIVVAQASEANEAPPTLRRLQDFAGAGRVKGPYLDPQGHDKDSYAWTINRKAELRRVIDLMWPYLGKVKRLQYATAREAVDSLPPPRHVGRPGWRKAVCIRGHDYSDTWEADVLRNGRLVHVRNCRPCQRENRLRRRGRSP